MHVAELAELKSKSRYDESFCMEVDDVTNRGLPNVRHEIFDLALTKLPLSVEVSLPQSFSSSRLSKRRETAVAI